MNCKYYIVLSIDINIDVFVVLDDSHTETTAINFLREYFEQRDVILSVVALNTFANIDSLISNHKHSLIIMDLADANKFNIKFMLSSLKKNYPKLQIAFFVQKQVSSIISYINLGIYNYIELNERAFNEQQFKVVLAKMWEFIERDRLQNIEEIRAFYPESYPIAIFTLSSGGPEVLAKDFEKFPGHKDSLETKDFLSNLAMQSMLIAGQGHVYHESCFFFPAGNSKRYTALLTSVIINNPMANEERLINGYYQLCLFIPNIYFKYFPPLAALLELVDYMKSIVPDAQSLNQTTVIGLKYSLLNKIRDIKRKQIN